MLNKRRSLLLLGFLALAAGGLILGQKWARGQNPPGVIIYGLCLATPTGKAAWCVETSPICGAATNSCKTQSGAATVFDHVKVTAVPYLPCYFANVSPTSPNLCTSVNRSDTVVCNNFYYVQTFLGSAGCDYQVCFAVQASPTCNPPVY